MFERIDSRLGLKRAMGLLCIGWMAASAGAWATAGETQHRFILCDESRHLIHWVDERDPSKDWSMPISAGLHDMQLIGNGQLLLSQSQGYTVYDLHARKSVQEVRIADLAGAISVRRRSDRSTVVGANQKGITVFDINGENAVVRKMNFPGLKTLRMMRLTTEGHVVLAEEQGLTEAAFDAASPDGGRILRRTALPRSRNAFMGLKKADGNYLLAGGYAHAFYEFAPGGATLRQFEATGMPQGLINKFYAGFQVLRNGNVVVCNWTGHGAPDSHLGWQLLEFAPTGKLVWKWHDPQRAGTALNVLVLDDLDVQVLNDDAGGVLGPAGPRR